MALKRPSLFRRWIQSRNPYRSPQAEGDGARPLEAQQSAFKRGATKVVVVFFLFFAVWASVAPIDAGVAMPGTVVVHGNRKAVQHPSGGVVDKILVEEGARVRQGDVLLVLNALNVDANVAATELDHINVLTTLSRVLSERTSRPAVEWDARTRRYASDPRLAAAMRLQSEVFKSRTAEVEGQQKILKEQLAGLEAQLGGIRFSLKERERQLELVAQEARDTAELAKEGFVPRNQAFNVERTRSDLLANIANAQAEIARVQATIASTRLQLLQIVSVYHRDLDGQISELQRAEQSLHAKVEALRFERSLVEIRAPSAGTVVGLKVHTVGGVVGGGQVLMEIVPEERRLIVDAQVPSLHIDKVAVGLNADLRFTSFNMTTTPVIPGKVILVGADKLTSSSQAPTAAAGVQGTDYYLAQIEITPEGLKRLGDLKIHPGMSVDVVVKAGERTLVSYILKPITDRFALAFTGD